MNVRISTLGNNRQRIVDELDQALQNIVGRQLFLPFFKLMKVN